MDIVHNQSMYINFNGFSLVYIIVDLQTEDNTMCLVCL